MRLCDPFAQVHARIRRFIKQTRLGRKNPRIVSALKLSEKAFLNKFDLGTDDLYPHQAATRDALLAHYGRQMASRWPAPPRVIRDLRINIEELDRKQTITLASSILEHRVSLYGHAPRVTSNGRIDWHFNPTSDAEWLWALNRHQWWPIWGLAYAQTHDERYAAAFVDQLLDWIAENPPLAQKNEKSATWRLMEVAMRIRASWIPCFGLFYTSPAFTDDAKLTMLRSVYDHARFLYSFRTRNNHFLRESNGLAYIGITFPEFKEASLWRHSALARLDQIIAEQFNQDGSHFEVSTGYQSLVVDEFQNAYDLLQENGLVLPKANLASCLEKMYDVLAYLARPDGTFPHLNDGSMYWESNELVQAGETSGHADWIFIGSDGKRGICPMDTSVGFQDAGWYVMRSDWSRDAHYLLLDAGPYGGHHGHEDKLSIEVWAFGQPFVVDSDAYTYHSADPFRAHFVSSQAHNTVLVDGKSQVRRWKKENRLPRKAMGTDTTWISQPGFDYVSASYSDGYGEFRLQRPTNLTDGGTKILQGVTHTRRILFVKPDYWLIVDELQSTDCHDYQVLFHTVPEVSVQVRPGNRAILNAATGAASLHIVPADPDTVKVSCMTGSQSPIQGWYSPSSHEKEPATAIIYERTNSASTAITTLLYPCPAGRSGDEIGIEPLAVDGGGLAFAVTTFRGRDYLLFAYGRYRKQFGPYESTASVSAVRTDPAGTIRSRFDGHSS